jgi:outer membrane receptor protein involved in Fe transport
MESGIKATISDFINDVVVENDEQGNWVVDDQFSSKHFLDESILAAYTSLNINLDKKTKAKAGLRYEYTNSNLGSETVKNIVDRKYGNWFPSVFVSRTINDNSSYNLSYTRRITRPTFNDMAPFVYFFDANTFFSGNPALQPAISNAVKADYIFKRLIFSLSYTREKNTITNFVPDVDANTNKQTFFAANQPNRNIYAAMLSLPFTISGWWSMQNNVTGEWQKLNAVYKGAAITIKQASFQINSTQTFTLPKHYSLELNGSYQAGGLFGLYKLDPMLSLNFGVQKKISPTAGTLSFNVTNFTGPPHMILTAYAPEENIDTKVDIRWAATTFKVTYTKSFGNTTLKGNRQRKTASEEEKERVQVN